MTTKTTERDLVTEVEELLAKGVPMIVTEADFVTCRELLRRLVGENKRIANAFLIAYDLAGMDTHPLPEALPESSYTPGYMDKVRELRAVFALIAARVKKENPDA